GLWEFGTDELAFAKLVRYLYYKVKSRRKMSLAYEINGERFPIYFVGQTDSEQGTEWYDISELRATTGQIRLLRILITQKRCTMQELADQLDVAAPTVTSWPQ